MIGHNLGAGGYPSGMDVAFLLAATPVFGFALTPPPAALAAVAPEPSRISAVVAASQLSVEDRRYRDAVRARARTAFIKRYFGMSSLLWVATSAAVGGVRYVNRYGGSFGNTPCDDDAGVFGDFGCGDVLHVLHLVASQIAMGLYVTTGILALRMPDPDDAASGPSGFARRLRTHRALAWVHLAGMIVGPLLNLVAEHPGIVGLDRRDRSDYDALRVIATAQVGVNLVTLGALTWAAIAMGGF